MLSFVSASQEDKSSLQPDKYLLRSRAKGSGAFAAAVAAVDAAIPRDLQIKKIQVCVSFWAQNFLTTFCVFN